MKATEAKLLAFLRRSPQFVIPIYQRAYSWTERECLQLWDDVVRSGADPRVQVHFVGSIVYVEDGQGTVTHQAPLLVIDGQQRLTTVSLLLAALAQAVPEGEEPADGFSRRKIQNYYLTNPDEEGSRRHKLVLSRGDKDTLQAIVDGKTAPDAPSRRIAENFVYFLRLFAESGVSAAAVCAGISKLMVVDIALTRGQDNPQLIFESMNSTGKELSQADLVRNFVLMGLEIGPQTKLYEDYWRPMEVDFGQDAYAVHFDRFMRHWLTIKTGSIPRIDEVYDTFKAYARSPDGEAAGIDGVLRDVRESARRYCAVALGAERDPELRRAFHDLQGLHVDVAYPLVLQAYADHSSGALDKAGFLELLRLVESYVFRRAVCGIPTNSMNKTFAAFPKAIRAGRYLDSTKAHFHSLPSYRRFPTDQEFARALETVDLYNKNVRSYCLGRLENHGRKELVPLQEYTIEHVMPQNPEVSSAWREELGADWEVTHRDLLHTLGNLTLTRYNSEYSDRPFLEKMNMEWGLRTSPLVLNASVAAATRWNAAAIQARAAELSKRALSVWPSPSLAPGVMAEFAPAPASSKPSQGYTLDQHPYLTKGSETYGDAVPVLFDAFRKAVLAMDPAVTEEVMRLYVAYKAETNFVDVVPQAKRLLLSINIPPAELEDPKGAARDVTLSGRWGNGKVEVGVTDLAELPYAMGLVRQALDRQLSVDD